MVSAASDPRVLVIGLDPFRVPGPWDPQPVADAIEVGLAGLAERGYDAEPCLVGLDGSDDIVARVAAALSSARWSCVLVGGGLRGSEQVELFESIVNLVRRLAPQAAIAFNSTPADLADAVSRSLQSSDDSRVRAVIHEHWAASERGDLAAEHAIYADDAVLDYPQSGERFRGRATIEAQRGGHPADRHFAVRRISGAGHLWVSECVITYDGVPSYTVSIMELSGGLVVHETQFFADPFEAPASRAALAVPMPASPDLDEG